MPARKSAKKTTKSARASRTAKNSLPTPPSLWRTIGPSFILLGLALGSGELILWPYLTAHWGLGLLWGGLLGISLQYVLNTEAMRYSLARGESVFVGFRKLSWIWPWWFILSTFIPWSLPGFSSASSQIFSRFLGLPSDLWVAIGLLLLTGIIISSGKTLVKTMQMFQQPLVLVYVPVIVGLALLLSTQADWVSLFQGLIGQGDGYWFFPQGIAIASFLGAFAYSGAGGNLNLAQSYYIKEKGFGMGVHFEKISTLMSGQTKVVELEGRDFADTPANRKKWTQWWWLILREHFIVFWFLGFASIASLALLAKVLAYGVEHGNDLQFLYYEAEQISALVHPFIGTLFLLSAATMLFSTQVGVLESSSRIISENVLLVFFRKGMKFNTSLAFYVALWAQIMLGIVILLAGFQQPRFLLTLGAVLNGAAMMVAFALLFFLNRSQLPKFVRPGKLRQILTLVGFGFFATFFTILLSDMFLG